MYGAILGDIIGSPYEWHNIKTKEFPLFRRRSRCTDDSVMTIAVADALMSGIDGKCLDDGERMKRLFDESMHKWGLEYPGAGYGGRFIAWLGGEIQGPYNSYGNGSAMRVSPVAWISNDIEEVRKLAGWSAEVTHNHPEGIKGAEAVASAVLLSRKGWTKDEIKEYIESEFDYDLDRSCDEIRPHYSFDVSCQGSVPEAIISFLEGDDFEDVIRNAVSLGGDSDTIAAIAGSIAEAFYGVPEELKKECESRLPDDLKNVLTRWQVCSVSIGNEK